jgi:hypothetical protein
MSSGWSKILEEIGIDFATGLLAALIYLAHKWVLQRKINYIEGQ